MANWPFTRGMHAIGNGLYGYIQPDGTWGFSNAGLIVSEGRSLLVDTLMSVPLTREMLREFKKVEGGGKVERCVNTHANPDHFIGNCALEGVEIIGTVECARDIAAFNPHHLTDLSANWRNMGDGGEFVYETMGKRFDYSDVIVVPPKTLFERELQLSVGAKKVRLIDLGPAHTSSDTIAYIPDDRVVFTGDLLFNEGTPVMWAGPVENWIKACDFICDLDVEVVVPGHGPITDKTAVRNLKSYFEYVRDEARERFDAGMKWEEAGYDINLREFKGWSDPERIVANVFSLYRAWGAPVTSEEGRDLFGAMGRYHKAAHQYGGARS